MEIVISGIVALVALGIGIVIGQKLAASKTTAKIQSLEKDIEFKQQRIEEQDQLKNQVQEEKRSEIEQLQKEKESIRSEKDQLALQVNSLRSDNDHLQEKLTEQKDELTKLQEKFTKEFENLANKILDQKSEKFTNLNKENIEQILNPLKDKIKTFEEKVDKNNQDFIAKNSQLGQQLKNLQEQNIKVSEEANNLTRALKGDKKAQGNWGELILERVLEQSGLEKGREYETQATQTTDDGKKLVPDVIVWLPNDKKMVIDSKVSLSAYEKFTKTDDEAEKKAHLKQHVLAMKTHINQLSEKNYQQFGEGQSPDFVLMFIPIEPALYIAQNEDANFFYTAFKKNILMVSPTTLLSTLRTVDMVWKNEKQQQNANEIAKHAGSLYDKFVNLIEELKKVGRNINTSKTAYDDAMRKLTGQQNLIKDVEKLRELGADSTKRIGANWIKKAEDNAVD